jgi:hypothetical protein
VNVVRHTRTLLGLAVISSALVGGCFLLSAQMTIVHDFGDGIGSADQNVYTYHVDLNDNDDYREHHDKIKSVEAFGFKVEVSNLIGSTANAEGYLSFFELNSPTVEEIQTQATRIFSGIPLQPNETRAITYEESQNYLERLDVIDEAVKEGVFWFYAITEQGTEVEYTALVLVITVNLEA